MIEMVNRDGKKPDCKIINGHKYWLAKKTGYFKRREAETMGNALKKVGVPYRIFTIKGKYYIYYRGNK